MEKEKGSGLFDCLSKALHLSAPRSKSPVSHSNRRLLVSSGEMSTRLVMLMVRTARCLDVARLDERAFALNEH